MWSGDEVFYDFAANYEAHGGGHPRVAGGDGSAVRLVCAFGDGDSWFLIAEGAFEMGDALFAEFLAHDACEGVHRRLAEVGHSQSAGVEFVGGSHAAYMSDAESVATSRYFHFGFDGVNTVDNVVVSAEVDVIGVLGQIELLERGYLAVRIDVGDTFGHNVYLRAPYGRVKRYYLAVDIGSRHNVVVDDVDGSDTAAGEHFNDITSHSPDAEDDDAAVGESADGVVAE